MQCQVQCRRLVGCSLLLEALWVCESASSGACFTALLSFFTMEAGISITRRWLDAGAVCITSIKLPRAELLESKGSFDYSYCYYSYCHILWCALWSNQVFVIVLWMSWIKNLATVSRDDGMRTREGALRTEKISTYSAKIGEDYLVQASRLSQAS